MAKRIVCWKPVRNRNIYGREYFDPYGPRLVAKCYRGELVDEILSMPEKKSISFAEAMQLVADYSNQEFDKRVKELESGKTTEETPKALWFYENFVQFISEQGYHIELTGDEFESLSPILS